KRCARLASCRCDRIWHHGLRALDHREADLAHAPEQELAVGEHECLLMLQRARALRADQLCDALPLCRGRRILSRTGCKSVAPRVCAGPLFTAGCFGSSAFRRIATIGTDLFSGDPHLGACEGFAALTRAVRRLNGQLQQQGACLARAEPPARTQYFPRESCVSARPLVLLKNSQC